MIGVRRFRTAAVGNLACAVGFIVLFVWTVSIYDAPVAAQSALPTTSGIFRVGEKLSYNLSFGKIQDAGYAEMHIVSRGKLSGKDAVEIRAKVKTVDLVSAAFYQFDSSRTTFASPDTGLPLYVSSVAQDTVLPKEIIRNFLAEPTSSFDLLTVIYKAREADGIGSYPLFEDQLHTVVFQTTTQEKVKTLAGEFDTTVSMVQSDFLTANGIKELKINFSNDGFALPVLVRMKTLKGEFRATLTSVTVPEPEPQMVAPTPMPTPTPTPSPRGAAPSPTPPQYIDNQPLIADLGFALGEVLDFQISAADKPLGKLRLNAKERKLVEKTDTLVLTATITAVEPGAEIFRLGEYAQVFVDPDSLAPSGIESKFTSPFAGLKQTVVFDRRTGTINFGEKSTVDAPIGTHTYLSLIYAMRSFNLKHSKNVSNPVNDTRVAVFWENRSYVFTLRPSVPEDLTLNGEKVLAQRIVINTGNKELDALNLRVWLRVADRVPVRFSAGPYQFDLITISPNLF